MQRFNNLTRLPTRRPIGASIHPVASRLYASKMTTPQAAETDTQAEKVANITGVTGESIKKALETGIGAQHVDIEDMSGTEFDKVIEVHRLC